MKILITGSSGLIGSDTAVYFDALGHQVLGVDNNMRQHFFGATGDTTWNRILLEKTCANYTHFDVDIRDQPAMETIVRQHRPDAIIHTASQPSHDWASTQPLLDFEINGLATVALLELVRQHCPEAFFIYLSTNKVYGDGVNRLALRESKWRFDFADLNFANGIGEDYPIDQVMHSLFGVSKCAGDLMTQEYGRYFGIRTTVLRCGCMTGPSHSGVEAHGFLNYLIKCAREGMPYTIFGHRGKQVRDQIHSRDVAQVIHEILLDSDSGEVYNIGGGRENSASILECIHTISDRLNITMAIEVSDLPRKGDHICYYTDTTKFCRRYPSWKIKYPLDTIIKGMLH